MNLHLIYFDDSSSRVFDVIRNISPDKLFLHLMVLVYNKLVKDNRIPGIFYGSANRIYI